MYDVSGTLPVDSLEPGTSVLCRGPPLAGKRSLGLRTLVAGLDAGEGGVVVTAQRSSAELADELRTIDGDVDVSRLAVVDCVAGTAVGTTWNEAVSVSSPADLTGIGMAVTEALKRLRERGSTRNRLFLDGLSTLLMYADFERVYRFCHTLIQHVEGTGSLAVLTVDTESMSETDAESIRALFPVIVELDVSGEDTSYRLVSADERTDFEPVPWVESPTVTANGQRAERRDEAPIAGLAELVDRVESRGQTLTLFEPNPATDLDDVQAFFERQNVTVETAQTPDDGPRNFAVLHRGGNYVASASVPELEDAVTLDGIDDAPSTASAGERLLESLDAEAFNATEASVEEMVRISRSIERTAWRVGEGTLHAGFQRLSRVADERSTREVYETIADRGVDVHLYGAPDHETALDERFTVHDGGGDEIAESWFVLLADGDGGGRRGLVCKEHGHRRYSGVWTFDGGVVETAIDYLERTY